MTLLSHTQQKGFKLKRILKMVGLAVIGYLALLIILLAGFMYGLIDPFPAIIPETMLGLVFVGPEYFQNKQAAKKLLQTPQTIVSPEELESWPTYSTGGITLKYPPFLEHDGGNAYSPRGTWRGEYFYDNENGGNDAIWHVDDHPNDRLTVRVFDKPFNRTNVTSIGRVTYADTITLRWKYPQQITINDLEGYFIPFIASGDCAYEHYAFPDRTGQKIVKISFSACHGSREVVRPYKDAILSSLAVSNP